MKIFSFPDRQTLLNVIKKHPVSQKHYFGKGFHIEDCLIRPALTGIVKACANRIMTEKSFTMTAKGEFTYHINKMNVYTDFIPVRKYRTAKIQKLIEAVGTFSIVSRQNNTQRPQK
jgi:hypothetical protein